MSKKRILVLTGTSGSGKTTIANQLAEKGIPRLITSTTRPMRTGEINGKDYHFLQEADMRDVQFVEQTDYNGHIYGLSEQSISEGLNKYDAVCIVMDQNGAEALSNAFPGYTQVIHLSVDKQTMTQRMEQRGDSSEAIQSRISHAEQSGEFDENPDADLTLYNLSVDESLYWINDLMNGTFACV